MKQGQVSSCDQCPLDTIFCGDWLNAHFGRCPTAETYTEACQLAEKTKEA